MAKQLLVFYAGSSASSLIETLLQCFPETEVTLAKDYNALDQALKQKNFDLIVLENPSNLADISQKIRETVVSPDPILHTYQTIQALLNAPTDIACVLDLNGIVLVANDRLIKDLNTTQDLLVGKLLWDFFPPEAADFRKTIFEQVKQTKQIVRVDDPGRYGYFDSIVQPIFNQQGEVVQIAILARDITERIETEAKLREREAMLRSLIESASIVLAAVDQEGKITFIDGAVLRHAGLSQDLKGKSFSEIENIPDFITASIQKALLGEELTTQIKFTDQSAVQVRVSPVRDANEEVVGAVAVGVDISDILRTQEELKTSQLELERKIEQRTEALNRANLELQQRVIERQRAASEAEAMARIAARLNMQSNLSDILQVVTEEALQAVDYQFCSITIYDEEIDALYLAALSPAVQLPHPFPPAPRQVFESFLKEYGSPIVIPDTRQVPNLPDAEVMQMLNLRTGISLPMIHDGELIGFLNVASMNEIRLPNSDELKLLQTLADQAIIGITKARLFEQVSESRERLRSLSTQLVEVQEQDRRILARELHDEIGQTLTLLRLNLDIISRKLSPLQDDHDEITTHLANASDMTARLLERIREISLDLRPTTLDDLGLIPALLSLFERFTSRTNIYIRFKHSGVDRRFDSHLETTVFRIIQESLTNVAKHADVEKVSVRLWADSNFMRLQVEDVGKGFDLQPALQSTHTSGLSGMMERAASSGGVLEIDTELNVGTCISAEFPLYIYGETAK